MGSGPGRHRRRTRGTLGRQQRRQHHPAHRPDERHGGRPRRGRRRPGRPGRRRRVRLGGQRPSRLGAADRGAERCPDVRADPGGQRPAGHRAARRRRLGGRRAVPGRHPHRRRHLPAAPDRRRGRTHRPCGPARVRLGGRGVLRRPAQDRPGQRVGGSGRRQRRRARDRGGRRSPVGRLRGVSLREAQRRDPADRRRGPAGRFSEHSLDPARIYDLTSHEATRMVYDGLLAYHYSSADPQVLVPDLATAVPEPTDGGKTYTFNLRPGIRYSTGAPVQAADFVRGVHRALMKSDARPDFYKGIVGGRACIHHPTSCDLREGVDTDNATGRVTFHLAAPDPQFLYKLSLLVVPAPRGTPWGKFTSPPLPGTGPYRIATYDPGRGLDDDPQPVLRRSGRPRPSLPASRTSSPGSRWPTPGRQPRRCWRGGRTSRSSPRWARRTTCDRSARRGAVALAPRPRPPGPRPGHRLRGHQLLDAALLELRWPVGRSTTRSTERGRRPAGWASRRRGDLPADATDHAVLRALLPVHHRAQQTASTTDPTWRERVSWCGGPAPEA